MRHFIELIDSTGKTWRSDETDELTDDNLDTIRDLFSNFGELTNLSLEIGEVKHYFNPAHVVMAALKVAPDNPWSGAS